MNTIAIDCGASFLKGALFHGDKMVRQQVMPSIKVHGDEDILEIVQIEKLVGQVKDLLGILSKGENKLKLCISNEMHGFILAKADGTPYTDYISWQKEYGNILIDGLSSVSILNSEKYQDDIYYSGMGLRGGLPNANLLYLYRKGYLNTNEPLYFYTLGDYIIKRLTDKEPACHSSNAAATGLYDFRSFSWNTTLTSLVPSNIILPVIGDYVCSFKMDNIDIDCLPAVGDQQAALLGAGLNSIDDISFNLGTGAQVSCLVDNFERDNNSSIQIRPFFYGKLLRTMPHLPSGRAMNVYIRFLKDVLSSYNANIDDDLLWSGIQKSMSGLASSNLNIDLSFFQNPLTDCTKGSISNIGEYELTLGNLFYSLFSQMAANFLKAAKIICPDNDKSRIVFSGGVARKNHLLRSLILSAYGENVITTVAENETLKGLNIYGSIR